VVAYTEYAEYAAQKTKTKKAQKNDHLLRLRVVVCFCFLMLCFWEHVTAPPGRLRFRFDNKLIKYS